MLKKSGLDPENPANFRPISNLNTVSKILEKLFLARIKPAVGSSENFCRFQSAYQERHSTETALLKIFDEVYRNVDNQLGTMLVTFDISAAFDCVVHEILLTRLQRCYGISGIVLQWIKSYLEGRSQFVKIQDKSSETENLGTGVPQGSCLGPFLYCVCVSTLASVVPQNVSFHQYADDTQLYCGFKTSDYRNGVKALEDCSAAVEQWFLSNGLLLNAEKSDAVVLSTSQQAGKIPVNSSIRVAGCDIRLSDSVRNLGVVIDSRLSFNEHVSSVCRSCYFHMKAFRQIRHSLTIDTSRTIARSIVMSRLDYCNSVLYGTSKSNLKRLQHIQNSLVRLVYTLPYRSSCLPLLKKLSWLPIEKRINFKIALLTFKCRNGCAPKYLSDLVTNYVPRRSLRSSDSILLTVNRLRTGTARRSFSAAKPEVWNKLPIELRQTISFSSFKSKLKTFLFNS